MHWGPVSAKSPVLVANHQLEETVTPVPFSFQVCTARSLSALEFLETMQLNRNIFPNILN